MTREKALDGHDPRCGAKQTSEGKDWVVRCHPGCPALVRAEAKPQIEYPSGKKPGG